MVRHIAESVPMSVGTKVLNSVSGAITSNATITVGFTSDCDFVCEVGANDHRAKIQAAIDAIPSTGGIVLLREGVYDVQSTAAVWGNTITTKVSGTIVTGIGPGTVINYTPTNPASSCIAIDNTFCVIENMKFVSMNDTQPIMVGVTANGSDSTISSIWVYTTHGMTCSVNIGAAARVLVDNVRVVETVSQGWTCLNTTGTETTISNCCVFGVAHTDPNAGFGMTSGSHCAIFNNVLQGVQICMTNTTGYNRIIGNDIRNAGGFGITFNGGGGGNAASSVIADNYIEAAVGIQNADNTTQNDYIITGNRINCTTGLALTSIASRFMVHGNNFYGCTTDISDSGTGTLKRDNVSKDGAWLAE